jgi:hypothetical protein
MKINVKYIIAFFILLLIEVGIGLCVHDKMIRPYIGDVLVIILMYTFIKGITKNTIRHLPLYLFLFALAVEFAQYFRIVDMLHLQNNKIISTIIGTSFDIKDIVCYFVATVILMMWEHRDQLRNTIKSKVFKGKGKHERC